MANARSVSGAALYGRGVFTTLAIIEGLPCLWDRHWTRLSQNAASIRIDLSDRTEDATLAALKDEIASSGLTNCRARITFSDESPSRIWSTNSERKTSLSIIVAERRPVPENFKLTISPHHVATTSPLVGIKSCNYLEHLLAYKEASKRGFHEAVRLNERGEIASACMANVFWEKDGKLFTPTLATGCLPGTTREYILEKIECEEVERDINKLESADRIFITSAGIGIVAVAELNGRLLDTSGHPLTNLLPF